MPISKNKELQIRSHPPHDVQKDHIIDQALKDHKLRVDFSDEKDFNIYIKFHYYNWLLFHL